MVNHNATSSQFNPLAWGIMFFSIFLSLKTLPETDLNNSLSFTFLAFSVIMFAAIWSRFLSSIFEIQTVKTIIAPIIFLTSFFGFIFSYIGSISSLDETTRCITIIVGSLWMFTFLILLVINAKREIGLLASITFVGLGVYHFISQDIVIAIILVVVGLIMAILTWKKPHYLKKSLFCKEIFFHFHISAFCMPHKHVVHYTAVKNRIKLSEPTLLKG